MPGPNWQPAQDTRQHVHTTQPNVEGVHMPRNTFILTKIFNFIVRKLMVLSPACLECILTSIHLFISIFSVRTTSQVESEGPPTCQVHRVWPAVCQAESPPIPLLPHSGPLTSTPKSFSHQSAHLLQRPFQHERLRLLFTCLCSQTHTNLADRKLNVSIVQSRKKQSLLTFHA